MSPVLDVKSISIVLILILFSKWSSAQYLPLGPLNQKRYIHNDNRKQVHTETHQNHPSRRDVDLQQSSTSREIHISSFDDFCLFGPPDPFSYIWATGLNVDSWCVKDGYGTRLIPDGTLHGVTFVKSDNYFQVSGNGDFTKINLAPGDQGGQFDSTTHTPDGTTVVMGDGQTASSWVTIISATTFCFRACTGDPSFCPSNFPDQGCYFLTSDTIGLDGTWQDCQVDDPNPPGVIGGTTYTPDSGPGPTLTPLSLSNCQPGSSVSNGQSPPPLHSWNGQAAATSTSSSSFGDNGSGSNSSSSNGDGSSPTNSGVTPTVSGSASSPTGSASTSWVSISTCAPCASASASASISQSASLPAADTTASTIQVGITQLGSNSTGDISTFKPSASQSSSSLAVNDQPDRRDDVETTTSGDQCCWTTWTPSIISTGGTAPTQAIPSGSLSLSLTASGNLTGLTNTRSLSGSNSGGGLSVPTGSGNTSASGVLKSGSNSSSNSSGNGSESGAMQIAVVGLEGMGRVLMGIVASIAGGMVLGWCQASLL